MRQRRRTRILIVAAAVAATSAAAGGWAAANPKPQPTRPDARPTAPPTIPSDIAGSSILAASLPDPSGTATTIRELAHAKPVVVNFWASWCAPCVAEMPLLEAASAARRDDVIVIGVNELDDKTAASAMAARTGISYPWLLDADGALAAAAETVNLPTTILIDTAGTVKATRVGAFKSADDFDRWLDSGLR